MDHRDRYPDTRRDDTIDEHGLVLHAENVDVHTERVAAGRVILRKQVITEEVQVPVTLRREELEVVEESFDDTTAPAVAQGNAAIDRPAGDVAAAVANAPRADVRDMGDGEVEITLYAERPVVRGEVGPVERVRVRRGVVSETQRVDVEVSHEEAYVEHDDGAIDAGRRDDLRGDVRDDLRL